MKELWEHIRHIPPPVWIGVLITVVVAIVITRWSARQSAQAAAQGAMAGGQSAAAGNAAGAAQAAGVDSVTTSSFLTMQTAKLSDMLAANQTATLAALTNNSKETTKAIADANEKLITSNNALLHTVQTDNAALLKSVQSDNAALLKSMETDFTHALQLNTTHADAANAALGNQIALSNAQLGAALQAVQQTAAQALAAARAIPTQVPTPVPSMPLLSYAPTAPTPAQASAAPSSGGGGGGGGAHYNAYSNQGSPGVYILPNIQTGGTISVTGGNLQDAIRRAAAATGVSVEAQARGGTFGLNTNPSVGG